MNFERKKVRGRSKRHYKEWHDTEGLGYRLTWRNEAFGVAVVPAFYACVKVVRLTDGFVWWNFCQHRRPYKTLKKAVEACLRNQKLWAAFIELGAASGRRGDRLKELVAKGMVGGGHILSTVPEWAKPKCDPTLLRMLYPACKADSCDDNENDQSDPTSPSPTTEPESAGPTPSAPSNDSEITPREWPCLECRCLGRIYDPDDPPCPIEGNKLRNRIKCPTCGGTGFGTKEEVQAAYRQTIDRWKHEAQRFDTQEAFCKSGLAKLTQKEKQALGL